MNALLGGHPPGAAISWPQCERTFGNYELQEEIARGGMGVVWKARQIPLKRTVAVKMLLAGPYSSPEFVQRFRAEAEAAANLHHPNIVAIYEVGEQDGLPYFAMEYVDGSSLAQRVRENPMPPRQAAQLARTIAEAVHYAHQHGVIHRDLKPSNILIDTAGQPRVTDFGLAKRIVPADATNSSTDLTVTGQMLGTPSYAPPEQMAGRRGATTTLSDVYSIGAILYSLLTGRPPFAGERLEETLDLVLHTEPVSPRLLNPALPRDLTTICLKCLEKEPARRYATAHAIADDLGRFLNDETILARPATTVDKVWRWSRRKPALAALVVALHLVGGAGLAGVLVEWRRAEQHAARETALLVRAEEAVTKLELQDAEHLLESDDVVMGVANLARILRQQPTNQFAARRLLSALTQREFALPLDRLFVHAKKVAYAEFSPDDRRVVTASLDFTARVWDAVTGEPLTPPMTHPDGVRLARFSNDGERILTYSDDFCARLWDAATGQALGQPMCHEARVRTAEFNPDASRIVTASDDGSARIWDGWTGAPLLPPLRHRAGIYSARFSPDGTRVLTASIDGTVQLWNAATGRPLGDPLQHGSPVNGAKFSPDGRRIITMCDNNSVWIWDIETRKPLPLRSFSQLEIVGFSPDGERAVAGNAHGDVYLWTVRDGAPLGKPIKHHAWVNAAEFSSDGQRLLTGSTDGTARLWDGLSGEPLTAPLQHDGPVWSARLSHDGRLALTTCSDGTARIWDIRPGRTRSHQLRHSAAVLAAEFSPDSKWVVSGSRDGMVCIWNARTARLELTLEHTQLVVAVQFSPDGKLVATAAHDHTARIWDSASGLPWTPPLRHDKEVDSVQFSPDGCWLATGSTDNTLRLWNARTGKAHLEPIRHRTAVRWFCFSPDSQTLLSTDGKDDSVQIHDVATGRLIGQTPPRDGQVLHLEFSRDGQRILTASEDGSARLWDARTFQPLAKPMWHKSRVVWAQFSPDGRWIVTASDDTTARIWDAQNGEPLGEPLQHRDSVNTAEFSPDGRLVLTASFDGTARLWDVRTRRPAAEPFQHGDRVLSARFSRDGRRVLTAAWADGARLWDVPATISEGTPASAASGLVLADLAEGLIGKRVNAQGALESIPSTQLTDARRRIATLPSDGDFTRWLKWFFADRSSRAISPYSGEAHFPPRLESRAARVAAISRSGGREGPPQ
jgi:WD40 repeat protein/serine/threonine protein kinase